MGTGITKGHSVKELDEAAAKRILVGLFKSLDTEYKNWDAKWKVDPNSYTEGRMDGIEWATTALLRLIEGENK